MKGPAPAPVEIRRRQLMTHDRELYAYIEARVAARELDRAGGDASGATDNYGAANRVWALAGTWEQKWRQMVEEQSSERAASE